MQKSQFKFREFLTDAKQAKAKRKRDCTRKPNNKPRNRAFTNGVLHKNSFPRNGAT